ncbi:MAG: head-tail connector protein [Hyphomicrobiaceae bacterium]
MALILTAPPAVEPVSLVEAKAHLRVDGDAENILIQSLILTSRLHIETAFGLALIQQSWAIFRDAWPSAREVMLPLNPIKSIDAIRLYDATGTFILAPLAGFTVDSSANQSRLVRHANLTLPQPHRPANGIEIAVTAGFGPNPSDVPAPIRHALLLLVAHWYEHRDPSEIGTEETRVPQAVSDLLAPWRPVRLGARL